MSDQDVLWRLVDNEHILWSIAVLLYGAGDTSTTLWGFSTEGADEIGPLVGPLVDLYGISGLFIAKIVSLFVFVLIWYLLWKSTRVAVPLALIVVGGVVTVWNLYVVLL